MSLHIDHNLKLHGDHDLSVLFKAEQARQQALLEGDVAALSKLLHPDAVYIDASGAVDVGNTFLEPIRIGEIQYVSIHITVDHFRYLAPTVVLLSGSAQIKTIQFGEITPLDNLFMMTWVRRPDGWKMSSWQSTPSNAVW